MKGKLAAEQFLRKTVNMFVSVPKLTWDTMVTVSVFGADLSGRVGDVIHPSGLHLMQKVQAERDIILYSSVRM